MIQQPYIIEIELIHLNTVNKNFYEKRVQILPTRLLLYQKQSFSEVKVLNRNIDVSVTFFGFGHFLYNLCTNQSSLPGCDAALLVL